MKSSKRFSMISKHFIITALGVSFFFIGWIFQNYLMSITVGAILAMATRPIYESLTLKLAKNCKISHKRIYISSFLTLTLFLFVFLPLIYFVSLSYQFIPKISVDQSMAYMQNLVAYLKSLPEPFDVFQESINALLADLNIYTINIGVIKSILNNVADFFWKINGIIYQFFLILFFYFLFNIYGHKLFVFITRLLPMAKKFKRLLFDELSNTISSVFFGTLFSMSLQGIAFGLFIHFTSDYDAFYFGMAAGFMTAIPVVGTYIVAIPIAVVELLSQNYFYGGLVILFALVVMSGVIDNFLRLFFMKYLNRNFSLNYSLGEFFILLAMLAGIGVFGGWGIIIAPAILSLCVVLIDIYIKSSAKVKRLEE